MVMASEECPTGSGRYLTIDQIAEELTNRLARVFLKNAAGERQVYALYPKLQHDIQFRDYVNFYEYFEWRRRQGRRGIPRNRVDGIGAKFLQSRPGYSIRSG
jgi:hypothetical protein